MSLVNAIKVPNQRVLREDFYVLMESHLPHLRRHPELQLIEVNSQIADKYMGDFHGLLNYLNVEMKYHYFITRINGYNTSTDYDGLRTTLIMPPADEMNKIFNIYSSVSD